MLSGQQRHLRDELQFQSQYLESMMMREINDDDFFLALNNPNWLTESRHLNTAKMDEDGKLGVVVRLMRLFNTKNNMVERNKIALFLVRYMHRLNRTGWQAIYGDKHQYLSMIELLINNRHERDVMLTHDDLDLVLKEGMRVGSDHAYETYLRLTLLSDEQEGFENQVPQGRFAAARYAKLNKKDFLRKIQNNALFKDVDRPKYKENIGYLVHLSALCKEDYFYSFREPTPKSVDYLANLLDKGILSSEAIFQMAVDLDYGKIIFMLGQYHAKKAFDFYEQAVDVHKVKEHVDYAEKYFTYLRELPLLVDKVKMLTQNEGYGRVLEYIGISRVLEAEAERIDQAIESKPGLPYISLGADYGHQQCVGVLLGLINRDSTDETFEAYLDKYLAKLSVGRSIDVLNELLGYKKEVLNDVRRQFVIQKLEAQQKTSDSLSALPLSLQYQSVIEGGIDKKLECNGDLLHVHSGGSSVYMVVTKVDEALEANDDNKPRNDEYKLYVAFDPYKSENYANCWRALLTDVLGEDNVYGVKMMNPKDAEADYDFLTGEQRVLKENAQPGKMAVIYFKKYETLKSIRGEDYTEAMFYRENLALIEKFERALKVAGVTNDKPSVVPDHSLPAQIKREGEPLVFISGRETDADGKYVPSKDRPENTFESNPYTNKTILTEHYGEAWVHVAHERDHSFESALSSSPNSAEVRSLSDTSSREVTDLGDLMRAENASGESSTDEQSTSLASAVHASSQESNTLTASNESPAASLIAKPKPSFLTRAFAYYKTNPWKAAGLTIGAVLSVGLVVGLSIATAGAFPFVAGGIAAAAAALHITVVGASIGALTLGGLSTLGFVGTLGAMLVRTARQKSAAQPANALVAKPASRSTFAQVFSKLCGSRQRLLIDSVRFEPEPAVVVAPVPVPAPAPTQAIVKEDRSQERKGHWRKPSSG